MADERDPNLPDDLRAVEQRLRQHRVNAGPAELDRVKRRAMAQFRASGGKAGLVRTRLAGAATAVVLLAGAGGAVALSSLDSHANVNGGAAATQYKPPPGCHKKPHAKCGRPPSAQTGRAGHVTKHSAELTGRVVVYNHVSTNYYFAWGMCPALNHRAGSGRTGSSKDVSATVNGLNPGTKYCYQLVASNSRGTSRGGVQSFHTGSAHKAG